MANAKATPRSPASKAGAGGSNVQPVSRYWLVLKGSQYSVVEADEPPLAMPEDGESYTKVVGVYQTRDEALSKALAARDRQFSFHQREVL